MIPARRQAPRPDPRTQQNGHVWEEDVFLALLYAGSPELVSWYVNFAYAVRAPQGVFDRDHGVISTVIASRATTPEWEGTYRLVQRLFTQGLRQQMADTEAFGRTLAQHRAESAALQQQVTQERQASQDRIADLRRESLGGVETYATPTRSMTAGGSGSSGATPEFRGRTWPARPVVRERPASCASAVHGSGRS